MVATVPPADTPFTSNSDGNAAPSAPIRERLKESDMTHKTPHATLLRAAAVVAILSPGASASLPAARIELPDTLGTVAPLTLESPIGMAGGDFRFGDLQSRFERQASHLELFGRLAQDRALASYTQPGNRRGLRR